MKRSNSIQLILITAALASCNRNITPPAESGYYDWEYNNNCPCDSLVNDSTSRCLPSDIWNFYPNWYFSTNPACINSYQLKLKGPYFRNNHFVVRGGWGCHGMATS